MDKKTVIVCDGINPEVKKTFEALSQERKQTPAELLRTLITEFVKQNGPKPAGTDRRKISYFTRLK